MRTALSRRGLSLAELLVAFCMVSLFILLAVINVHGWRTRTDTASLAGVLAEELRAVRLEAIARGEPMAVAFPGNGFCPQSQSIYVLEGPYPKVARVVDYAHDYAEGYFFNGFWSVDAARLEEAGLGLTGSAQPLISTGDDWSITNWHLPQGDDTVFAFTPAGTVKSNRALLFDNSYHIVVSAGAKWTRSNVENISTSQATAFCQPFTVTISTAGLVSVTPGVVAGQVDTPAAPVGLSHESAPVHTAVTQAAAAPIISSVTVYPEPNTSTLPANVDATVASDGYLTLYVRATSPQGDPLTVNWEASSGSLSSASEVPMEFNAVDGSWSSTWEWRPGAAVGGQLTCKVRNSRGVSVSGRFGTNGTVGVLGGGKLVYMTHDGSVGGNEVAVMNDDGTDHVPLGGGGSSDHVPTWSPDGSQIAYVLGVAEPGPYSYQQIYVMNADGTGAHAITQPGLRAYYPAFTPDGRSLIYCVGTTDHNAPNSLVVADNDGQHARTVPVPQAVLDSGDMGRFTILPSNRSLVQQYGSQLYVIDLDSGDSFALRQSVVGDTGGGASPIIASAPATVSATDIPGTRNSPPIFADTDLGGAPTPGPIGAPPIGNPTGPLSAGVPALSADGTHLTMTVPSSPPEVQIADMGTVLSAVHKLQLGSNACPDRTGSRIVFDDPARSQIRMCNADGSDMKQLTNIAGINHGAMWWQP